MPTKSQIAVLLLTALAPGWAQANVVTSSASPCASVPSPSATTRVFSVGASVSDTDDNGVLACLYAGMGNINGKVQPKEMESPFHADYQMQRHDWTLIDSTGWLTGTPTGLTGGNAGAFAIAPEAYLEFNNFAIGFKAGVGALDPDFAIFELAPLVLEGSWRISGQQALSHVILWGKGEPSGPPPRGGPGPQDPPGGPGPGDITNPNRVPEPASLALVGLGLLIAVASTRRRGSTQA